MMHTEKQKIGGEMYVLLVFRAKNFNRKNAQCAHLSLCTITPHADR